jgi:twitching motility protein PilT
MFEQAEEQLIRNRLASMLRWIVSQRLLPKEGGGRLAALEIMRTNLRVQDSIIHGESEGKTFYEIIDSGVADGMQTFDKSILLAYQSGYISEQSAFAYASQRSIVRQGIDRIKNARGEKTTDLEGLALDADYEQRILEESRR